MTLVGAIGVFLSLLAFFWFSSGKDNKRLGFFLVMLTLHITASVVYYFFVLSNDADTKLYYFDDYRFYYRNFEPGTVAVVWFTQFLKKVIGGSYLDFFLIFQAFGFWGLILVYRTLEDCSNILRLELTPIVVGLMFLPGMYFWTGAIGKDPPMFLASALAVWAVFAISKRWVWFGLAIAIMVLIRPHVALVSTAALAFAVLMGRGVPLTTRIALLALAFIGGASMAGTLLQTLRVDVTSITAVVSYVENQTSLATQDDDTTLVQSSFAVKLISLLYRPFFVDTNGVFGLLASLQNFVMVFITWKLIGNFRIWVSLFRASLPVRFATFHLLGLIFMLSFAYYNLGLGLRQREMATPALVVIFALVYLVSNRRKALLRASNPAANPQIVGA